MRVRVRKSSLLFSLASPRFDRALMHRPSRERRPAGKNCAYYSLARLSHAARGPAFRPLSLRASERPPSVRPTTRQWWFLVR